MGISRKPKSAFDKINKANYHCVKIPNILLSIMFIGFTVLQFNDPDPITWSLIYGIMALVCMMAAFRYYIRRLMLIQAIAYIIYAALLWPGVMQWLRSPDKSKLFDDLAKMEFLYIEETREFIGLLICLTVLAFYWYKFSRSKPR